MSNDQEPQGPTPRRRRHGPIYDDAMKILADYDFAALLSVVGVGGGLRRLNAELTPSATRPDLLARTPAGIVHVEFVKVPTRDLGLRMADYQLRLLREYPDVPVTQYVLALGDIFVPDRFDNPGKLTCTWSIVRISDLDPAALLSTPGTAALATLARGTPKQRAEVLLAAVDLITDRATPRRRVDLLAATATLASIVLPKDTVNATLKEAAMPVPVRDTPLGREIFDEGVQSGLHTGRQEGRLQAVLHMTTLMLRQRFGDDPRIDTIAARLADLPDEERIARLTAAASLDDLQR